MNIPGHNYALSSFTTEIRRRSFESLGRELQKGI